MLYRTSLGAPQHDLRREIDRLFENALGRGDSGRGWIPAVNVRESSRELKMEFELPGIAPENVEVTCENGVLTVSGEKTEERKEGEEGGRYHLVERSYGEFTRSFQLPRGVDESEIDAEFENGILTVRIPKAALPEPRRIEIGKSRQGQVRGGQSRSQGGSEREVPKAADSGGDREQARAAGARGEQGQARASEARGEQEATRSASRDDGQRERPSKGGENRPAAGQKKTDKTAGRGR